MIMVSHKKETDHSSNPPTKINEQRDDDAENDGFMQKEESPLLQPTYQNQ